MNMKQKTKLNVSLKQAKELKFISVKWQDAFVLHGWVKDPLEDFPCITYTAGFLLKKTKLHYVIASSVGQTFGTAADITYVPIKMVQEIKDHGKVFEFTKS